jgi:hypothetical protein
MEVVTDDPPSKPIEALPYETPRPPAPGRRVGLVMVVGFALLGISVFPFGFMVGLMEHYPPQTNASFFMGVIGGVLVVAGLGLIVAAAWEMLRR